MEDEVAALRRGLPFLTIPVFLLSAHPSLNCSTIDSQMAIEKQEWVLLVEDIDLGGDSSLALGAGTSGRLVSSCCEGWMLAIYLCLVCEGEFTAT